MYYPGAMVCTILKVGVIKVVSSTGISCRFSTRAVESNFHVRYTRHGSELEQSLSIDSAVCILAVPYFVELTILGANQLGLLESLPIEHTSMNKVLQIRHAEV